MTGAARPAHPESSSPAAHAAEVREVPRGRPVELVLGKVRGERASVSWFDPRTGNIQTRHETSNTGRHTFTPPSLGAKEDWVLIIETLDAVLPPF